MTISEIDLKMYRNFTDSRFVFSPAVNVVWGLNAQGKTNLVEAIHYLSSAKSFRGTRDRDLVFEGHSTASITVKITGEREKTLRAVIGTLRRKEFFINDVKLRSAKELMGVMPSVLFSPEDLYLIRDGAAARRRLMDSALCQLFPRYLSVLGEYNRTLEHKLRILRDCEQNPSLFSALPEFNEKLARSGAVIIGYRSAFVKKIASRAAKAHGEISGEREKLRLCYKTVSTVCDPDAGAQQVYKNLVRHMEEHAKAEQCSRSCLSGPHKDDIEVCIDARPAKVYASQGQTRTAALSVKLAERELFREEMGEYPLLLLDDVMSELDAARRDFVLNSIRGGQVLITGCEDSCRSGLRSGRLFHIESGKLTAQNDF